ncbi:hypothetical protein [uncultured Sulfitobacter sp.]|uniref:hypothetical protein n=1 Tax=uncultured Sulfitobacter sp. TaxID=191468 RepID=UPI0026322BE5|nr:hypothetical protein [uncultured Sulfitobacter sp.]
MSGTKTTTPWENISNDFWWLPNAMSSLANIAVIIGVVVAICQFRSWRAQRLAERKADAAMQLLVATDQMQRFLISIRRLFVTSRVGIGARAAAKQRVIQAQQHVRVDVKAAKLITDALIENEELKSASDDLLMIYDSVSTAAAVLSIDGLDHHNLTPATKEIVDEMLPTLDGQKDDKTDCCLSLSMERIEKSLRPIIQLR